MKRFCRDSTVFNLDKPDLLSDMFKKNISENHKFKCTERDILNDMLPTKIVSLCRLSPR